jgi:ubiquitin C-terminal hydrolase
MKLFTFFNLGNTCYLNSVLQCFINDPCFKQKLKKTEKNEQLFNLISELDTDLTDNGEKNFKHYNLIKIVEYFNKKFKRFQQHDSHEFLLELLDQLDVNYNGQIKTCLTCNECNNKSTTLENFTTIDLYINKNNLIENFMDYLKQEEIHDYHCENCKKNVIAIKKIYLQQLGEMLIIVLKKYHSKKQLTFPFENLKIRETQSGDLFNYKLHAVIYHHGNTDIGHYNCNVNINGNWYFMDDENIFLNEKMNYEDLNSYILFYKKV